VAPHARSAARAPCGNPPARQTLRAQRRAAPAPPDARRGFAADRHWRRAPAGAGAGGAGTPPARRLATSARSSQRLASAPRCTPVSGNGSRLGRGRSGQTSACVRRRVRNGGTQLQDKIVDRAHIAASARATTAPPRRRPRGSQPASQPEGSLRAQAVQRWSPACCCWTTRSTRAAATMRPPGFKRKVRLLLGLLGLSRPLHMPPMAHARPLAEPRPPPPPHILSVAPPEPLCVQPTR
jgi:hypothetical protein